MGFFDPQFSLRTAFGVMVGASLVIYLNIHQRGFLTLYLDSLCIEYLVIFSAHIIARVETHSDLSRGLQAAALLPFSVLLVVNSFLLILATASMFFLGVNWILFQR